MHLRFIPQRFETGAGGEIAPLGGRTNIKEGRFHERHTLPRGSASFGREVRLLKTALQGGLGLYAGPSASHNAENSIDNIDRAAQSTSEQVV